MILTSGEPIATTQQGKISQAVFDALWAFAENACCDGLRPRWLWLWLLRVCDEAGGVHGMTYDA